MRYFSSLIVLTIGIILLSSCDSCVSRRYKSTGIALGGGGAKAAAEIGVLEELEEMGVHIDYIAGTSMGAVVGGLYAAGYSAKELREMWLKESWLRLFDKSKVCTLNDNNRTFFGVINGEEFERRLRKALAAKGCRTFSDLRIPFVCVATRIIDNEKTKEVHLGGKDMDLARAIRASMTYPFPLVGYRPIKYKGMTLVDGGMMNNLPVDVVAEMGADRVIAVDLDMKDYNDNDSFALMNSLLAICDKFNFVVNMTNSRWLVEWCADRSDINKCNRNRKYHGLIHIRPDLDMFSILSFYVKDAQTMMFFGKEWTKKEQLKLKKANK